MFRETVDRLVMRKDENALMALKMGCMLGLSILEIANAKIENIDKFNKRSLYIDVAKSVKRGNKYQMRCREQPIPRELYLELTEFVRDADRTYILKRKNKRYSNDRPFTPRHIAYWYTCNQIEWSSHASRKYYSVCCMDYMRKCKFIQPALLRNLLGHKPDVTQGYFASGISFEYKLAFIDKIEFYKDIQEYEKADFFEDMQETITKSVKNGVVQAIMGKPKDVFIAEDWILKVMRRLTPSNLYLMICNDDNLWLNLPFDLKWQTQLHKEAFNRIDIDMILQLIKENNLDMYSTLINTEGGLSWIYRQIEKLNDFLS